ncbi:cytochrome c [Amaricoccus solimangrovi]|uniref:C-type cytochrome n=1 Tax=Amaricoccus solimangrovi TaxID=2589815 RepID=A0A501WQ08_9RHOB|nr:cytochrome c [Amaricoccus solimangrovi]TPE50942.1 c-type cytochrome [Amaricoccus solimangrovi]
MLTLLRIIAWLLLLAIVAALALIFVPARHTGPQPVEMAAAGATGDPDAAALYAARVADCAGCHTADDGEPFAGGRPIPSPFGAIYSPNITPDPETGIGGITLDQFRAALYDGIGRDGRNLYPAMPYDSYRELSEADVEDLYHYFTKVLAPVRNEPRETDLPFPLDQRWGIRAWKLVGLPEAGFEPRFDDPVLDRGAYLVEGPGHCGACHSPRNLVYAQAGFTSEDPDFLTGGEIGGWTAPDLRSDQSAIARWSDADLKLFLASGRNAHAGVRGEMKLAIEHSLQYFSDDDLSAVVAYLRAIGPAGAGSGAGAAEAPPVGQPIPRVDRLADESATETERLLSAAEPGMPLGARLYLDNCAACHFVDGKGADQIFPALDGNSLVTAPKVTGLVSTILAGAALPSTGERPAAVRMPGFADRLSDAEVAELATFVRGAWHNDAPAVKEEDVRGLRDAGAD